MDRVRSSPSPHARLLGLVCVLALAEGATAAIAASRHAPAVGAAPAKAAAPAADAAPLRTFTPRGALG